MIKQVVKGFDNDTSAEDGKEFQYWNLIMGHNLSSKKLTHWKSEKIHHEVKEEIIQWAEILAKPDNFY